MVYKLPHPEAKPPTLDPEKVPPPFRHLIPLAEKYGVSDDCYRIDLIDSLDTEELEECAAFPYGEHDDLVHLASEMRRRQRILARL